LFNIDYTKFFRIKLSTVTDIYSVKAIYVHLSFVARQTFNARSDRYAAPRREIKTID